MTFYMLGTVAILLLCYIAARGVLRWWEVRSER